MGAGVVMMAGGIVGMVVCMTLLCILPGIFEKQRKKLLSEIENEIYDQAASNGWFSN